MWTLLNRFLKTEIVGLVTLTALFVVTGSNAQNSEPEQTASPPAPKTAPDLEEKQAQLLAAELEQENIVWLDAEGGKFPAIWQPEATDNPLGAVLMVHGSGQTPDWPGTLSELRSQLSDFGWSTLSVSLPEPLAPKPPKRPQAQLAQPENAASDDAGKAVPENPQTTPPEQTGQAPTAPQMPAVETRVSQRMQAGMAFLNSKGQYNIVFVGEGIGAARAARYLDSLSQSFPAKVNQQRLSNKKSQAIIRRPVRALVLINPRNSIPFDSDTANKMIFDWWNDKGLPIMDLYHQQHFLDEQEALARKKAARRQRLENYVQVKFIPAGSDTTENESMVTRRVRGFLHKYAKGVELEGR